MEQERAVQPDLGRTDAAESGGTDAETATDEYMGTGYHGVEGEQAGTPVDDTISGGQDSGFTGTTGAGTTGAGLADTSATSSGTVRGEGSNQTTGG